MIWFHSVVVWGLPASCPSRHLGFPVVWWGVCELIDPPIVLSSRVEYINPLLWGLFRAVPLWPDVKVRSYATCMINCVNIATVCPCVTQVLNKPHILVQLCLGVLQCNRYFCILSPILNKFVAQLTGQAICTHGKDEIFWFLHQEGWYLTKYPNLLEMMPKWCLWFSLVFRKIM